MIYSSLAKLNMVRTNYVIFNLVYLEIRKKKSYCKSCQKTTKFEYPWVMIRALHPPRSLIPIQLQIYA